METINAIVFIMFFLHHKNRMKEIRIISKKSPEV